jgi:integral membrane sensor domain MASE1
MQNPIQEVHLRTRTYPTLPLVWALGLATAVGIAYFLAARLSLALHAEPDGVAVFWPAAGVSSGVLIALGRDARLPVVGGVIVTTVIANLMMGDRNQWGATAFAFCDAVEALLAAWLIERRFGSDFSLDKLRNVLELLAAAVVATTASGIGGMVAFKLFHSPTAPLWTTWQHWFASDALGIITVAPVVIGLARALREPPPRSEIIEGVAALVALAATIVFVILLPFEPWQAVRPAVLLFPVLLWLQPAVSQYFLLLGRSSFHSR